MARGKTLLKLLNDVRAEARLSLDPAHNVQTRDAHINMIQREQERLWADFAWPHLRVHRYIPLQAGQRFYDPDSALLEDGTAALGVSAERIERIDVKSDGLWLPMEAGIRVEYYTSHDSMIGERAWPPRAWKLDENDDIEIWPVPDTSAVPETLDGYIRVTGIRSLRPLVDDSDRAELDDRLIVLYTAGAILAAAGAKDANLKLEAANKHFARMRAQFDKAPDFNMFSTRSRVATRTRFVTRYKPPVQP